MIVVVLDMDETLGVYLDDVFHVRPNVDFMIQMLRCMDADIILWSLGDDSYVQHVVNKYLPQVTAYAYKIFARTEAKKVHKRYGYSKAGSHIRDLYEENIFLLGVDDQVDVNMDSTYDVKIHIQPYENPDNSDSAIWNICEKIVRSVSFIKDPHLFKMNLLNKVKEDER